MNEFLVIAGIHLLAVASPGPDFAIILKQSINYGRRIAIVTSIGVGLGILVHVTYSVVGLGVLIANTPELLLTLKVIAAGYFIYIAWHGLRAKAPQQSTDVELGHQEQSMALSKALQTGFLINALNVKATLFFIALYSIVIAQTTSIEMRIFYGVYMAFATALWFSLLSYILSMRQIRRLLIHKAYWIERLMGLVLLVIALDMLLGEYW